MYHARNTKIFETQLCKANVAGHNYVKYFSNKPMKNTYGQNETIQQA
jgi:hypothetical protein